MEIEDVPTELRSRAKSRALSSALLAGEASGLEEAADLVQGAMAATLAKTKISLPRNDASTQTAVEAEEKEQRVRRETMVPTYKVLRAHGGWLSVGEIEVRLHQHGHAVIHRTVLRVLNDGVKAGHLERRGNHFRIAPLSEAVKG